MSSGASNEETSPHSTRPAEAVEELFADHVTTADDPFAQVGSVDVVDDKNQEQLPSQQDEPEGDGKQQDIAVTSDEPAFEGGHPDIFDALANEDSQEEQTSTRAEEERVPPVDIEEGPGSSATDQEGDAADATPFAEGSPVDLPETLANEDHALDAPGSSHPPADDDSPLSPIRLPEEPGDDPFAEIVIKEQDPTNAPSDIDPAAASPIRIVDTDEADPFSQLGNDNKDNTVPDQDAQDRDYSALLAEFSGLEEDDSSALPHPEQPEAAGHQANDLFGEDTGSNAFDLLLPSGEPDFMQTSSSSTTPPPDLSIENSFQSNEPFGAPDGFGGDISMQTDGSNWLADTTLDDEAFDIQADSGGQDAHLPVSASNDEGDSPLAFEVPYGWYDGDVFHYYTEEEREQVRMTMLGQAGWPSHESGAVNTTQDSGRERTASPALQPAFSENAARRTPNPVQYADPTVPSRSEPATVSTDNYFGNQYTPSSAAADPYAPTSSSSTSNPYAPSSTGQTSAASTFASPMQLADPYAPAPTAWDPYPDPLPSGQTYRSKPSPRMPSSAKPTPPQRVASTAYDPPFLRPQKSFARPVSAAPVASSSFGMPPSPAPAVAATPPPAPPSGPPRRSVTPNIAPPPPQVESRRQPPVDRSNEYSPSMPASSITPSTASLPNTAQPPRQPHRAPSYSSFDPPLRPQTASRPPSRATQAATLGGTSLLSPPSETASAFPQRPSSGASTRGPPAFAQPPPPSGPPRRSTPSFQPPPRPSSATSNAAAPPPAPSVPQAPSWSPPLEQGEQETLASPLEVASHAIPQLHSGQEEPDEEGGPASWSADEDDADRYISSAPRSQSVTTSSDPAPTPHDEQRSSPYDRPALNHPPPVQMRAGGHDDITPPTSRSPLKSPRESYHPYRRTSTTSPLKARKDSYDPYGPGHSQVQQQPRRSAQSSGQYDPYTPDTAPQQSAQPPPTLGLSPYSHDARGPADDYGPPTMRSTGYGDPTPPQVNQYAPAPAQTPYDPYGPGASHTMPNPESSLRVASPGYANDFGTSPSPVNYFASLHAGPADHTYTPQQVLDQKPLSEDPLGRSTLAARNKPLAIFGFGGVLLTSFPGVANVEHESLCHARTASYGYASGRGQIWIRPIAEVVSESALRTSETSFPGPLVLDPSTSKSAASDKKKKDIVLAYLNSRADEIETGLPYLKTSANATRREHEGKLALIRILIAMVIGDGKLSGSPEVDEAVRTALRSPNAPSPASTFSPSGVAGTGTVNGLTSALHHNGSQTISSAAATPAQLSQLSNMLANGDKRDAALFAASEGLWAHALLASSGVDQDFWREIVTRFTASELQPGIEGAAALKTSYTIFAGLGPSAIDDLMTAAHITDDPSTDQWREVISSLVFNGKPADMGYFDGLGGRLTSAGLVNAGHICSLLSPLSPFSDITPAALERPITMSQNARDEDIIIFAEIAEFARSLINIPKGQELPFPGLPQLLPYKLSRAWWAAELGDQELAQRYCTSVESASKVGKSGPSLLSRSFLNSLEDLQERLTGEPSTKPANLIGGRKQGGKPGVNKLGSWIEGRLTKFIAGEEDDEGPIKAAPPAKGKGAESFSAPVGPFSHFSTISPGPSNPVTRQASTSDMRKGQLGVDVDSRRTSPSIGHQQEASSSASSVYGGEQYEPTGRSSGYQPYSPDEHGGGGEEDTPHALEPTNGDDDVELLNPMAGLSLGATALAHNDYSPSSRREEPEEDEDDLGFGNTALSRNRTPKPAEGAGGDSKAQKEAPAQPAAPAATAAPGSASQLDQSQRSSGWLRGWFGKKEGEGSGPVRAKLGEESSMVYDNELKRWIVKGAKPEASPAATPPPPPRAQTASPSKTARDGPNARASSATPPPSQLSRSAGPGGGPPPAPPSALSRSSTAASLAFTETADGGIRRQKSSLAESTTPGDMSPAGGAPPSRPPTGPPKPSGASLDDLLSRPPSKRPASAARKGAKNRYVDVFQGQGNA